VTYNGVETTELEACLKRAHEILCEMNCVRRPALYSFNGWTADGRAVRHIFKMEGYERTGPTVERERIAKTKEPPNPMRQFGEACARAALEWAAKLCETGVDTPHPTVAGVVMRNFGASIVLARAIRAQYGDR
jgi:hypothetical protein